MKKDEILKVAQTEKVDEGRKYINDTALASVGSFAVMIVILLILHKIIIHEDSRDLLSLLIGMIGAFCYGKFALTSKIYWLIPATIFLTTASFYYFKLFGI